MSVCGRVASGDSHGPDNGETGAGGQPPPGAFPKAFAGVTGRYGFRNAGTAKSALQQRLDPLVEFLERGLAPNHLAIEEKGRRRVDLQYLIGELLIGGDLVEQGLILEAILDRLLAEPGLLAD